MIAAPTTREKEWLPGSWRKWEYGPLSLVGSVVVCPQCHGAMSVGGGVPFGSGHTIDEVGTVSPSVVCPYPPCTWHVFIRLTNWPNAVTGVVQ